MHVVNTLLRSSLLRPTPRFCQGLTDRQGLVPVRIFLSRALRPKHGARCASAKSTKANTSPSPRESPSEEHSKPPAKSRTTRRWLAIFLVTGVGAYIGSQARRRGKQRRIYDKVDPTTHFMTYELVSREPVSATSSIITIKAVGPHAKRIRELYHQAARRGCWSLFFKQPLIQIGRSYTPLPPEIQPLPIDEPLSGNEEEFTLRFLVRDYPCGEMSRYLQLLPVRSKLEIRGPEMMDFDIPRGTTDLLFIAGGTGIAPALQATYALLERAEKDKADGAASTPDVRVKILWANRRREDCLGGKNDTIGWGAWLYSFIGKTDTPKAVKPKDHSIVQYIEQLKARFPGSLSVDYFVDEEGTYITARDIQKFTNQKRTTPSTTDSQPTRQSIPRKLVLVSGPPGFVDHMAGPPLLEGGATFMQGPVRGILGQLGLSDEWLVWKL